jgi:hypothetical protein
MLNMLINVYGVSFSDEIYRQAKDEYSQNTSNSKLTGILVE